MKQLFIFCLLIFFLLPGCASMQVKREVINNTFYSSAHPKIQIKVNPELKYLGELNDVGAREAVRGTRMLTNWSKMYIFADLDGSRATRVFSIKLERTETRYTSDLFGWAKHFYEKGTCSLGGRSFQYLSRRIYPSMSNAMVNFITEKGYVLPRCVLIKRFARGYGSRNNILVDITYWEDPSELPYGCNAWSPDYPLQQDQIEYLERFNSKSDNSFAVIKYAAGKEIYTTADDYRREFKKPKTYNRTDQNQKKHINIQSRQPIYKGGKVIFYVTEGDTLDILFEKTCLSGEGICWKVKCRRTGKVGYVSETMIKRNHHVIEKKDIFHQKDEFEAFKIAKTEEKCKKPKKTEKPTFVVEKKVGTVSFFDEKTGKEWLILTDSRLVDYNTASNLCKSKVSDAGYIYRLPSPDEFRDLFKRHKGTDSLGIFEGRTFMTDSLGKVYPVVFSFSSGCSDKGFALTARVACINTDKISAKSEKPTRAHD